MDERTAGPWSVRFSPYFFGPVRGPGNWSEIIWSGPYIHGFDADFTDAILNRSNSKELENSNSDRS